MSFHDTPAYLNIYYLKSIIHIKAEMLILYGTRSPQHSQCSWKHRKAVCYVIFCFELCSWRVGHTFGNKHDSEILLEPLVEEEEGTYQAALKEEEEKEE